MPPSIAHHTLFSVLSLFLSCLLALQAEDSKWADEGSTLKERRAAEKAEKDRQKAEAAAAKKQLRDAEDNQDAESEAARKRKVRNLLLTLHCIL